MEIMLLWLTSAMTEVVNSFPGMRSNVGIAYNVCLVTHIYPGLQDRICHTDVCIPYPHLVHDCMWFCNVQVKRLLETVPVIYAVIDYGSESDWIQCWMKLAQPEFIAAVGAGLGLYFMFWAVLRFWVCCNAH